MSEDTAALVARVRAAVNGAMVGEYGKQSALAALAALERAARERDHWRSEAEGLASEQRVAEAAEARAQKAEQQRDEAGRAGAQRTVRANKRADEAEARAQKAEAVVEAARRYLHNVGHHTQGWMVDDDLRRALAALDEQEQAEPLPPDPRLVKRMTSDGTQVDEQEQA